MHDPDELREGLGRGISPADGHLDPLLDRATFKRAAPVARQGTHADGLASFTLFLDVLSLCILLVRLFVMEEHVRIYIFCALSSSLSSSSSIGLSLIVVYNTCENLISSD